MHATFVSTYPPRACGLATFAQDLRGAILGTGRLSGAAVVAVERERGYAERLPEVAAVIVQDDPASYDAAAAYVAGTGTDVVSVQHEFGIFGGRDGRHALRFMDHVDRPIVTTLHTVLPSPSDGQRRTISAVAGRSDRLVVMNRTAKRLLASSYGVSPERVRVIPHGTPTFGGPEVDESEKDALGLAGRTVLLTFGLLGPSKGIEFAIGSLAAAIEADPATLYVVLGATHPEVVRRQGEGYREGLEERVRAAGLAEHVRFVDEYVDTPRLCAYLRASDVYVSPYPGMDQITSGTLAYATGAGRPVVSTPYLHAQEALADGRGLLAEYGDAAGFGEALASLVADPALRADLAARTFAYGRQAQWPVVGEAYQAVLQEAASYSRDVQLAPAGRVHPSAAAAAFEHLGRLTDDTGVHQHAVMGVPDRSHGYCTDDAARALVGALRYARTSGLSPDDDWTTGDGHALNDEQARALALCRTYLAFLLHAQQPGGRFHNFMGYGRGWLPHKGDDEDTFGRALWGLGAAVALAPAPEARLARQTMEAARGPDLRHPRAVAYAACGWAHFLERFPGARAPQEHLRHYATRLAEHYGRVAGPGWEWFEDRLTYANAKLPEAMLRAGDLLEDTRFREVGLESLAFYASHTYVDGRFDFVGNDPAGFVRGQGKPAFDQQPIEAGYMADACALAFALTGEERWGRLAEAAAEWFCGRNRLGLWLYDPATGACRDGLHPHGVNLNEGAESAVACLLAFLAAGRVRATQQAEGSSGPPSHYPTRTLTLPSTDRAKAS